MLFNMKPTIIKNPNNSEFFTHEQCYITELSNQCDDPDVSVARARVKPGVTTHWHRLNAISERYLIESGQGIVEIADLEPQTVSQGDIVLIPPNCPQRITNSGNTDLLFLAICSPRFTPESYIDMETEFIG